MPAETRNTFMMLDEDDHHEDDHHEDSKTSSSEEIMNIITVKEMKMKRKASQASRAGAQKPLWESVAARDGPARPVVQPGLPRVHHHDFDARQAERGIPEHERDARPPERSSNTAVWTSCIHKLGCTDESEEGR